jgi:hypothetical protein
MRDERRPQQDGAPAKATFDDLRDCLYLFDELVVRYIRFFSGISTRRPSAARSNRQVRQ